LRSSLHPAIFGVAYGAANGFMNFLKLVPSVKATVLVALPKIIQSGFAAIADFYTWKLAESLYGTNSNSAWAAVNLSSDLAGSLVTTADTCVVLGISPQPLAVVLLHKNLLKFA
jgi:hypothetical protein